MEDVFLEVVNRCDGGKEDLNESNVKTEKEIDI